jgi:hypothetical protein
MVKGALIMSKICEDNSLYGGCWDIHPFEVCGGTFDPSESIAGFKPGDGDTHGDEILEVPECEE